jgi:hypothetical protein
VIKDIMSFCFILIVAAVSVIGIIFLGAFAINTAYPCTPERLAENCTPRVITEQEGIKLYRACKDPTSCWSEPVFFTSNGKTTWDESTYCGKGCVHTEHVEVNSDNNSN